MARTGLEWHHKADIVRLVQEGEVPRAEIRKRFGVDDEKIDELVDKQRIADERRALKNAKKREAEKNRREAKRNEKKRQERKGQYRHHEGTTGGRKKGVVRPPIDGGGGCQDPNGTGPIEIWCGQMEVSLYRIRFSPDVIQQEGYRMVQLLRQMGVDTSR